MGTSVASAQRVCALDNCTNPVEPVPSGEPRRYCRPEHRKMARRQRRDQAEEARGGAPEAPGDQPPPSHQLPPGYQLPGRQVPLGRPPGGVEAPYRRLVPEPKPRWFRQPRPYAARRVRPLRQRDMPPPPAAQPEWLRPAPAPARGPAIAEPPVRPSEPVEPWRAWSPPPAAPTPEPPRAERDAPEPPGRHAGKKQAAARRRAARRLERLEAAALLAGTPPRAVAAGRRAAKALAAEWLPQMREALLAALHSLANNRLRALLTTTGIVVGVAAVIVLVALGDGMKANFDAQFSKLANQAIVTTAKGSVPDGREPRKLTDQDVEALTDPRRAPHIAAVSPAIQGNVTVTAGQAKDNASLVGATENYLEMQNRRISTGSWFTGEQISGGERRVVLGQQAVHLLWGPGVAPEQLIGRPIRLSHSTFKIQGVLAADGQNDNSVIVPLAAARAYLVGNKGGEVSQITLRSTSVDDLDEAVRDATRILDAQHFIREPTGRDFNITTFTELLNQSTQFLDFLAMFIVAIAAISLFVGGVGVANIMLVSVTERTREIGIRKAVGAKTTAILRQFLSEAVILTGLGGAVGAVLGVAITETGAAVLPDLVPQVPVPILSMGPVVTAFAVSLAIGLLAGGYPAHRAARLRPIEALRFE